MSSELENKVTSSLVGGRLPCPVAFDVARELKVNRGQVGEAANRLRVKISDCQLGCFGSKKATHDDLVGKEINRALVDEIESCLVGGRLTCPLAFRIAGKLQVAPKEVGDAATMQRIRISGCQLGCFP